MNLSQERMNELRKSMQDQIYENTTRSIDEFDETLDKLIDKLASEGWTLPAELGTYAVNALSNIEEIEGINQFLVMFFKQNDYELANKMVDSILSSSISEGLKKMIRECWAAFQGHLYAICATSLLVVIEGVLSEFSEDKGNVKMMKVCQKQVDDFPTGGSTIAKHTWISYNQFIQNLYKNCDFNSEEPEEINRHWLLHGRSDYEITELDCIRLFNAVQSLCIVINKKAREGNENG